MNEGQMKIGINGLGRIGKLTRLASCGTTILQRNRRQYRPAGRHGLADVAHYLERDSTYGALHAFLHGTRPNR
jgi:glyceraldehyde 3-phosphate dehydrogenase